GTALVGVLNAFWESKGYCHAEEFSRFCGPTVPLARLPRRVVRAGDDIAVEFQVAHFGAGPLRADVTWSLRDADGMEVASGILARETVMDVGNHHRWGRTSIPAPATDGPAQYSLILEVRTDGQCFENDWALWVMPANAEEVAGGIHVTNDPHDAIARCNAGEDVLLQLRPGQIGNDVALGFTTVFWNTAWTRGQAPHTMGLLHDPAHPVFAEFPTDGTTDWQWWELVRDAKAMLTDALPAPLRPVVQPIDTWFEARPLGVLVEARLGAGRVVVTSLNLETDPTSDRLAARQFTRSLLRYMASPRFEPPHTIDDAQLLSLLR
ncbi:MAG TPA: hypothetical protein PKE42_10595, partial [Arachnia sp.]|nr:hypothetical protein [Arachnia sp.]